MQAGEAFLKSDYSHRKPHMVIWVEIKNWIFLLKIEGYHVFLCIVIFNFLET